MNRPLLLLLTLLAPVVGSAQVTATFRIDLPVVLPRLVVVQPGIQVVPDQDVEVFYVDGFYWTRRDDRWYRSRDHRGGWAHAQHGVPPGLVRIQPGHYRRYRPPPAARVEDRRDRNDQHRGDRGRDDRKHDDRGKGGKDKGGKDHGKRD